MMARIDVYEDPSNKEAFPSIAAKTQGPPTVSLQSLISRFFPHTFSSRSGVSCVVRETRCSRCHGFEEVLKRGPSEYAGVAELGMAQIFAGSGDSEKEREALAMFDKVVAAYPGEKYEEEAMVDKAHLLFQREDWKNAALTYQKIFENKRWKKDRGKKSSTNMGLAFEKDGNAEMALNAYTAFFAPPYENKIDFSGRGSGEGCPTSVWPW